MWWTTGEQDHKVKMQGLENKAAKDAREYERRIEELQTQASKAKNVLSQYIKDKEVEDKRNQRTHEEAMQKNRETHEKSLLEIQKNGEKHNSLYESDSEENTNNYEINIQNPIIDVTKYSDPMQMEAIQYKITGGEVNIDESIDGLEKERINSKYI